MNPKSRSPLNALLSRGFISALLSFLIITTLAAQTEDAEPSNKIETPEVAEDPGVVMAENREQLDLPGIKIQIKERYIDVDSVVCLNEGMLELIACAKDTKEHEAIIAVNAKASHIHAALLLLGARAGNPAMRKLIEDDDEEGGRWVHFAPSGSNVDVSLVVNDEEGKPVERPMSDFLMRSNDRFGVDPVEDEEKERLPTSTFLFAGSHVFQGEEGPPKYLADVDGNVISLSTFGDELLCLPGVYSQGNEGLVWEVDSTHLPKIGTKVILRLRPQISDAAPDENKD